MDDPNKNFQVQKKMRHIPNHTCFKFLFCLPDDDW